MNSTNTITTVVDVLRHGQCEGGEIYRGSTDVVLTELGWQQMANSLQPLLNDDGKAPWSQIISSPLKRCLLFSKHHSEQWNVPLRIEENIREMSFGDWEGQLTKEIYKADPEFVLKFYNDPENYFPPNSEHISDVQKRLALAWQKVVDDHLGEHVLKVMHGAAMRVLLLHILKMPFEQFRVFEIPFAGMIRLKIMTQISESGEKQHRVAFSGFNKIEALD
ncbi:histidine phosphatase family protein [Sessilibacter corallicola]|uniref:Alpha-ribazole phosphatase family protein n=1 Tax=Sessilibacter corallicola TaxID=2904075 RepID=A0ABQ0A7W4_9GAMM|nr:histidine phosphatase family protein [Sessilibacter corallicola]MCE2028806.1 histidine phosphatase family protein [Sessilibacter corallicola]